MKLYDRLPYSVEIDGAKYDIKPSFDRVLEALGTLTNGWTYTQKMEYICWLLIDGDVTDKESACMAVFNVLLPKKESTGEKAFDFEQDCELIYSAFLQAYGIDLFEERDRLHWLKFIALLNGLPGNTRFSEVIDIRTRPLPKANKHNGGEISALMKLKARFALKTTEAEQEINFQRGLKEVAAGLKGMVK